MAGERADRRADALLLLTVVLWSANFSAMGYALRSFSPLAHSALRFLLGGLLFSAWVLWREGSLRIARGDLIGVAGIAGVGILINQVAVVYAVRDAGAATVAMTMATAPIFAATLAAALGHERPSLAHWAGVVVACAGAFLVLEGAGATLGGTPLRGALLALSTAISWAAYSVLVRPLMERYSAARLSAVVLLAGAAMLVVVGSPQLLRQDWAAISPGRWAAFGYSLLMALVLTNVLWFDAIRRVGAARATLFMYLQPFLGALFALVLVGEHVGAEQWIGGVVILAGVVLATVRRQLPASVRNLRARPRASST